MPRNTHQSTAGASPRGRRKGRCGGRDGCISAWAEEPPSTSPSWPGASVHLSVGGGTRSRAPETSLRAGASPRGRRNQRNEAVRLDCDGCISAWAEEPSARCGRSRTTRVHLRVGGGTAVTSGDVALGYGASPRGRRNRPSRWAVQLYTGCISAWAEEPTPLGSTSWRFRVHLRVGGGTCFTVHSPRR